MAQQKSNGGGNSNGRPGTMISPTDYDALRRAKKARQKANGGRNPKGSSGYLEGLLADRKQAAENKRLARLADEYRFRSDQARKAEEHEWYRSLTGGPAKRFADMMLAEFPLAEPRRENGRKISRTQVAEELALANLSCKEVKREKAIKHGANVAREALRWAYSELTKSSDDELELAAV